jgi:hypothetical protein
MHPVVNHPITQPFWKEGRLWSLGHHTGVDYRCPVGTNVIAPASGYVARVARDGSFGLYVMLRVTISGVPFNVYLCHLSKALVTVGQRVKIGQHIAESGNTGNSTGPHLHLEVRRAPYGFNTRDIVDPQVIYQHQEAGPGVVTRPTIFDVSVWNLPPSKWYTPWRGRAAEIKRELHDEASINLFNEAFNAEQIKTLREALPDCEQLSSPWGLECFYTDHKYDTLDFDSLPFGYQNRGAQRIKLKRLDTGAEITIVHTHGPIIDKELKDRFGDWLAEIVAEANADLVTGDLNRVWWSDAPKKQLYELGYRDYKAQAAITNESLEEYIPKSQDLVTIATRPSGPTDVIGGEVDASTNKFEGDHRRIEARIVKAPA